MVHGEQVQHRYHPRKDGAPNGNPWADLWTKYKKNLHFWSNTAVTPGRMLRWVAILCQTFGQNRTEICNFGSTPLSPCRYFVRNNTPNTRLWGMAPGGNSLLKFWTNGWEFETHFYHWSTLPGRWRAATEPFFPTFWTKWAEFWNFGPISLFFPKSHPGPGQNFVKNTKWTQLAEICSKIPFLLVKDFFEQKKWSQNKNHTEN